MENDDLQSISCQAFPEHTCYVEPFCGAAALLYKKEKSKCEVLNDINDELINLYRVLQHHLEEFVKQFKWSLVSRKMFEWEQKKHPDTLTDIQRAARFYYLQKNAFAGKVASQTFGVSATAAPRMNLLRIEEDLSAAHLRLARVQIEHLPWHKYGTKHDRPHTLFFYDPPYWQTEGYGVEFALHQYELMPALMHTIKGKAITTVNDHPAMRKVFNSLEMTRLDITYTVGGRKKSKASELVIRNW
ncbi:MAG: DNA adenine methylase [Mariprofundaceae bacterium]